MMSTSRDDRTSDHECLDPAAPRRRPLSLRARWHRRFAVLLVVLVVTAVGSVVAITSIVANFRDTADRVEARSQLSSRLRNEIGEHTALGHSLLERDNDEVADGVAALEGTIRTDLERATGAATTDVEQRQWEQAQEQWEQGVAEITGLAAYDGVAPIEVRTEAHRVLATTSDAAARAVEEATTSAQSAERKQLDHAGRVAERGMVGLVVLAVVVVGFMVVLGRRLTTEILRPVGHLRDSADRLAVGDLGHRADVTRGDELGQLAVSFNAMADAVARSHGNLTREANHDPLTGLANRRAFQDRLDAVLSRPNRRTGAQAVVFLDLDDFKDVNDTLGHAAGDELLAVVAERLTDAARPGDVVARLGGDEFAMLLDGLTESADAFTVANRAVAALDRPAPIAGATVRVAASAGVALVGDVDDPEELMRRADVAMYLAKGRGKNQVASYDATLHQSATERTQLKGDLDGAAARGELVIDYQPIAELATGNIVAVEALVRWQHPDRGLLAPSAFIGLAEDTGAIIGIGARVLDEAITSLRTWQQCHHLPELSVSVNVSVRQLEDPGFVDHVEGTLRNTGVDPARLVIEITESVLAEQDGRAATSLAALRRLGVRIAIDDFGTGYSSMGYLHQLPVDILKIDRSFVSGEHAGEHGHALLETIIALGRRLQLDVIPEGIEAADQLVRLQELGCRNGQGYLLSRPVPPAAINAILASDTPLEHLAPIRHHGAPVSVA